MYSNAHVTVVSSVLGIVRSVRCSNQVRRSTLVLTDFALHYNTRLRWTPRRVSKVNNAINIDYVTL